MNTRAKNRRKAIYNPLSAGELRQSEPLRPLRISSASSCAFSTFRDRQDFLKSKSLAISFLQLGHNKAAKLPKLHDPTLHGCFVPSQGRAVEQDESNHLVLLLSRFSKRRTDE